MTDAPMLCTPRVLPKRLLLDAAAHAVAEDPRNAIAPNVALKPQHIALATNKYWGPQTRTLPVRFLEDGVPYALKLRLVRHMNAWSNLGNAGVRFSYTRSLDAPVRVVLHPEPQDGGYWSYIGTDINLIPSDQPTMCLEDFSMDTPDSEFHRVVRHEAGHTLGFVHEHMRAALVDRLDPDKVIAWAARTQGWDAATARDQILRPLSEATLMATPPDQTSVMCYQLPGELTKDGQPILGGRDINASDAAFAGRVYPRRPKT